MDTIQKASLTPEQMKQVKEQLDFIGQISLALMKKGYRVIIGGGYAVDGVLGEITRPHRDIDIQVYGKEVMNPALLESLILDSLPSQHGKLEIEDKGKKEYWHSFFIHGIDAEIYYFRVMTKPFSDIKIIVKSDDTYTEEQEYQTKMVFLNGVRFEAQNAVTELADKIYTRDFRGDARQEKHEQDIYNLRQITDPYDIQHEIERRKRQEGI